MQYTLNNKDLLIRTQQKIKRKHAHKICEFQDPFGISDKTQTTLVILSRFEVGVTGKCPVQCIYNRVHTSVPKDGPGMKWQREACGNVIRSGLDGNCRYPV